MHGAVWDNSTHGVYGCYLSMESWTALTPLGLNIIELIMEYYQGVCPRLNLEV